MQMRLTLCLENRPWEPHQKQFLKKQGFHMPIANHPPISPIPEMDRNGWYKISRKGRFMAGKNHVVIFPPSGIPNRTGPSLAATGCRWDWPTEQSQNGLDPLRPPSTTGNDLPIGSDRIGIQWEINLSPTNYTSRAWPHVAANITKPIQSDK